jgi:hypothetical protein
MPRHAEDCVLAVPCGLSSTWFQDRRDDHLVVDELLDAVQGGLPLLPIQLACCPSMSA